MRETITSPSFILMAEYEGRLPLFHVDLYRLADATEAVGGGLLDDRWSSGVTLIEWPDRMGDTLPPERLDVVIAGPATSRARSSSSPTASATRPTSRRSG